MLPLDRAVDLYLGELARRGRSPRTIDAYRRKLWRLCADLDDRDVAVVTADDCRRFLDRWQQREPGTLAHSVTTLNGFFRWLYDEDRIERSPMERIRRPPLRRPEDLDVVTVTAGDVLRILAACETWTELLTVALLAYLGPRRAAASRLRRRDYDFERGTIRFLEKGARVIEKPVPDELVEILAAADDAGALGQLPDDYLVPMEREQRRAGERDPRFVWRIVRRVSGRAGVRAHVHALRAAFAVHFLETHPEHVFALQELMGHRKIETTRVYLRKLDRAKAMEAVRDLSWAQAPFDALPVKARSGLEPLLSAKPPGERESSESAERSACALIDNPYFRGLLERLRETERERRP